MNRASVVSMRPLQESVSLSRSWRSRALQRGIAGEARRNDDAG